MLTTLIPFLTLLALGEVSDDALLTRAMEKESQRIAVVERVLPAVVCIFDKNRGGGGSGVIIDEHGYGLTNFHVVAGLMSDRAGFGGLSDGQLHPLEVLGVDITGDVAMFRLTGQDRFTPAPLGDSDSVAVGDSVIAMGNPFVLAEDYTPTVTLGIVTGVHRYQGESDTLVYTDCIQTDAAINPGNSGGPLFDGEGRVIGINGRISAEMHKFARGRVNVGLGYAISINQIKRFMPTLRAGMLGRHGTLDATVTDDGDQVIVNELFEDGPGWKAGMRVGDRLLRFGDVPLRSANQFLSILGTYPERWPVAISYESRGRTVHKIVRLEPINPPMRSPYVQSADPYAEALQKAFDAYREAVCGKDHSEGPRVWTWSAKRTMSDGATATFRVVDDGVGPGAYTLTNEGGEPTGRLEWDGTGETAAWVSDDGRRPADADEVLLYRGLRLLRRELLAAGAEGRAVKVSYLGSDALTAIDEDGRVTRHRVLEAVGVELTEQVVAEVGFESTSHLPARLSVRDLPTGRVVEVEFDDYREGGGVLWPHRLTVQGTSLCGEETISELSATW